ncbi:putative ABC transport system permease protein [Jatrophihabitans sp. GAS493]|uniref:ABC transporter permease n=1 Tax=Jatrophihabitans sp. GAS493 TaxID=1907575 RepID=UPI000BB94AFD|nr:ABC transporter permease [Jatrophihabitans sp. GAS493]SOD74109.1 putative ABC transport system permease protein [Jatrophihabitans sp. GAS493]
MNLPVALRFATVGIAANKMRSALTTLGILIGVSAVIILLAVGTGSSAAVKSRIAKLGSATITVSRQANGNGRAGSGGGGAGGAARAFGGGGFGGGAFGGGGGAAAGGASTSGSATKTRTTDLTLDDAKALTDTSQLPDVKLVAPQASATSVVGGYTGVTHTISSFLGSTPSYFAISNDDLLAGSYFGDNDYLAHSNVVVLGTTVAQDLVGGTGADAVGKTIQLNGGNWTVSGVLASKGTTSGSNADDLAVAPLTTVEDKLTGVDQSLTSILVEAKSSSAVDSAEAQIESVLDARHVVTSSTRDYSVSSAASIISTATSTTQTLTVLLGAVAAISLLVGGIGVMNIMLVTVTERTREIGVRKAIGAGKADIVVQFLAEAVLLSVIGGLVGVAIGLIGSRFTIVGVQPVVASWSVFLAFGVAVAVGLFFGIYPANRAASLKPIDALRYE